MAAGKCSAAYHTDEWNGYGCSITEGPCMFLYPDSKACAERYGEGPDAEEIPAGTAYYSNADPGRRRGTAEVPAEEGIHNRGDVPASRKLCGSVRAPGKF